MKNLSPSVRRCLPAAATAVAIGALSLLPACAFRGVEAALPPIRGFDKIVHALMYAALTAACLRAWPLSERGTLKTALKAALIASLYGAVMELCQKSLTVSRQMDPLDELANAAGACASALVLYAWARRQMRRREPPAQAPKNSP